MKFTRRQFLKTGMAASAATAFPSIWLRASQASALCEATGGIPGVNLIIVYLDGGNDGINMVVPMNNGTEASGGHVGNRAAYDAARLTTGSASAAGIGIGVSDLVATQVGNDPLHGGHLALHPHMQGLKSLYNSGNLAVVLGTYFTKNNDPLSHNVSQNVWYGADPELSDSPPNPGWMGQILDTLCTGQSGVVPAVDVDNRVTPLFYGDTDVFAFTDPSRLDFPLINRVQYDATQNAAYKNAFKNIYNGAAGGSGFTSAIGVSGYGAVNKIDAYHTANDHRNDAVNLNDLINGTSNGGGGFGVQNTPQSFGLAKRLRTAFSLLRVSPPLGCRIFRVSIGGFDSHSGQGTFIPFSSQITLQTKIQDGFTGEDHGRLLHNVDAALSAFWQDCKDKGLSQNTLIMTFSEFGRRIGQNKNKDQQKQDVPGTDHGTSAPHFIIGPKAGESTGPAAVVGYNGSPTSGMYGAYPELDMADDDGNAPIMVDFRNMYAPIINKWLGLSETETNTILGAGGFTYSAASPLLPFLA